MPARRPCLDCGTLAYATRCPTHQQANNQARDQRYTPAKQARRPLRRTRAAINANAQLVRAWRQTYGDVCPGLPSQGIKPHPSADLTAQHSHAVALGGNELAPDTVLCRSCNAIDGVTVRARR